MIFQRQTDAAEKAISWLQESLDCFRMLQFACAEINENLNPVALVKLFNASKQADKLSSETNSRLNQIYLYYDFSEIEKKYNIYQASLDINHIITEILKLDYQASD